jgi:mono/diheme cytochrome c family protein
LETAVRIEKILAAAGIFFSPYLCGEFGAQAQSLQNPAYTAEQAKRGEKAYMESCSGCHGDQLDNGQGDGAAPLVGPAFSQGWSIKPLDELYTFTSTNMPANAPGTLSPATYADLVAFLLSKNGVPPGAIELPTDVSKLKAMAGPK